VVCSIAPDVLFGPALIWIIYLPKVVNHLHSIQAFSYIDTK
jgi:hypothetical protein